jgi:S-adenosylmethionine hydrolase
MHDPLITLTTDFGTASPYVASMKGVLLTLNPAARLLDLSHDIPPQDIRHAAFFLASALPTFPAEVIHLVVVDPGVGTARAALYVEVAGHRLVVPDNGCWTLLEQPGQSPRVIHLSDTRFFRSPLSATFHGRDLFAPVAAHLSLGVDPGELGAEVTQWHRLTNPAPLLSAESLVGEVVFIDHFGNLITNIPGEIFLSKPGTVWVRDQEIRTRVGTYGEAPPNTLVALVSSAGLLEVAQVQGNAANCLQAGVGTPVVLHW